MIIWLQPAFFYLFFLVAMFLGLSFFIKTKNSKLNFSYLSIVKMVSSSKKIKLLFFPTLLKYMALSFVVFSLARPQLKEVKKNILEKGLEIMLVLDISESMNLADLQPTRLIAAKKILKEFIRWRKTDKMGLLLFSGAPYMHVPLTLDHNLLLGQLKKVKTLSYIKQGTAIGVALASAIDRLRLRKTKNKIIILLTDGENNTGEINPAIALKLAKKYNIKIYTVGVGKQGLNRVPVVGTNLLGKKVTRYQTIKSKVNKKLLNKIAIETQAQFYLAESNEILLDVFKSISLLETSKIKSNNSFQYKEKFYDYLIWAILFYSLALLLEWGGLRIYS